MAHDPRNDNARVKRYIAKLTTNPALSHASYGRAVGATSIRFVSQAGLASGAVERDGLAKRMMADKGNRTINKADRVHNAFLPVMQIDAAQRCFLFCCRGWACVRRPLNALSQKDAHGPHRPP